MPLRVDQADRFEHAGDAEGREFAGEHRLLPTRRHEAHGREVVDLVRADRLDHVDDRKLVEQVGLVQRDPAAQVGDALEVFGAGPADDAVDFVALFRSRSARCEPSWPVMPVMRAFFMNDLVARRCAGRRFWPKYAAGVKADCSVTASLLMITARVIMAA